MEGDLQEVFCVRILALSKDTSRTQAKKRTTHHLLMAAIKDVIK